MTGVWIVFFCDRCKEGIFPVTGVRKVFSCDRWRKRYFSFDRCK